MYYKVSKRFIYSIYTAFTLITQQMNKVIENLP